MKICYYQMDEIDSTSDWAKRHIQEVDADTLYVVSAKSQTKGRGRWGRSWISPPGVNLYLTLLFQSQAQTFCCSQLTCLVLQKLLQEMQVEAEIKWPNDLLVKGSKIAGVLAERSDNTHMIGIGLNVNMDEEMCKNIPQKATSARIETGTCFELEPLIHRFVTRFIAEYEKAVETGFSEVSKSWHEKVQWMISQPASVQTHVGRLKGHISRLDSDGSCLFLTENGQELSLSSGDIQIN